MNLLYNRREALLTATSEPLTPYEEGVAVTNYNLPTSAYWKLIAYGNGKFVAIVNTLDIVAYSTDGINWTQGAMSFNANWKAITYGGGKFVVIADNGTIAYSTDGIDWTQTNLPDTDYSWVAITYGDNKFVAITSGDDISDVIAYSTDGINWTQANLPMILIGYWSLITYGDGKFVAISDDGHGCAWSNDGITWYTKSSAYGGHCLAYGDGKFVSLDSYYGTVTYSIDGINWELANMSYNANWASIAYGNGKFVTVADDGVAFYSTDGINWSQIAISNQAWKSIAYGDGKFIAVAENSNVAAYIYDSYNIDSSSENIKSGVTLNGVTGTYMGEPPLDSDIKEGVTINGVTGTYKGEIIPYVVNENSIVPTGAYASATYYNTSYGVKIGYMSNGSIILSMQGGTSTSYEKLYFYPASLPSGITLSYANAAANYVTGQPGLIYACVLNGVTSNINIALVMNTRNSTYDYAQVDITVTEV